eukprot:669146_1
MDCFADAINNEMLTYGYLREIKTNHMSSYYIIPRPIMMIILEYFPRVDLMDFKKELSFDQRDMERQIEFDRDLMHKLSTDIHLTSSKNFELDKNLTVVEHEIPLLIHDHNMISLAELNSLAGGVFTVSPLVNAPLLVEKKALYEQLFDILHKEPKYLATLTKHVRARNMPDYVKTVVFGIYGDAYDSREEHLLLTLFQMILKRSFDEAQDISSFLRNNSAIARMLSAYAVRGQGLCILREILEKPIREMVAQTSLILENDPVNVYQHIISAYEAKFNKPWDGVRNLTSDEAADNKYVKRLIPHRRKQLQSFTEQFMRRIMEMVDRVPFGIRWICRQLTEMAQHRFPEADHHQINAIVGRFIYLRFFHPVLVRPQSLHFIDKKVSKNMRRNLSLVAKECRDNFIEKNLPDVQTYFTRLIDVDSLSDRMDVELSRDFTIPISLNQIFLTHRLLLQHTKEWTDDRLRNILAQLGPASDDVKHHENHSMEIRIIRLSSEVECVEPTVLLNDAFLNNIRSRIRSVLLNDSIPQQFLNEYRISSFKAFLYNLRDWARNHGNIKMLVDTEALIRWIMLTQQGAQANDNEAVDTFLVAYVNDIRETRRRAVRLHLKVIEMTKVRDAIVDHAKHLQGKLEYYQTYLSSIKPNPRIKPSGKVYKARPYRRPVKFSHKELLKRNVIIAVNEQVLKQTKANFNNLMYYFSQIGAGEFEVEVKYRVGFGAKISPFPEPTHLSLSKLLMVRDTSYQLEMVNMEVNLVIDLLFDIVNRCPDETKKRHIKRDRHVVQWYCDNAYLIELQQIILKYYSNYTVD